MFLRMLLKRKKQNPSSKPDLFGAHFWKIASIVALVLIVVGILFRDPIRQAMTGRGFTQATDKNQGKKPDATWSPQDNYNAWNRYQDDQGLFEVEMEGPSSTVKASRLSRALDIVSTPVSFDGTMEVNVSRPPETPRMTVDDQWAMQKLLITMSMTVKEQNEITCDDVKGLETYGVNEKEKTRIRRWDFIKDRSPISFVATVRDSKTDLDGKTINRFLKSVHFLK